MRVLRLLVLAGALHSPAACASDRSSIALRFGGSASYLTGALGNYYPRPNVTALVGLGVRLREGSFGFRTGLELVNREATSRDTTVVVYGRSFTEHESWRSLRLQVPILAEARFEGPRSTHPYMAGGVALDTRVPEALGEGFRGANPTDARRFGSSVLMALGLESMKRPRRRIECGYVAGLTSLYRQGQGRPGSWRSIHLVFDVDLN